MSDAIYDRNVTAEKFEEVKLSAATDYVLPLKTLPAFPAFIFNYQNKPIAMAGTKEVAEQFVADVNEREELRQQLARMTADRDSWAELVDGPTGLQKQIEDLEREIESLREPDEDGDGGGM